MRGRAVNEVCWTITRLTQREKDARDAARRGAVVKLLVCVARGGAGRETRVVDEAPDSLFKAES